MQSQYELLASKMQALAYDPLDVTNRQWYMDLTGFLTSSEGLEKQLIHALQQAYYTAGNLSYKLCLLPVGPSLHRLVSAKNLPRFSTVATTVTFTLCCLLRDATAFTVFQKQGTNV